MELTRPERWILSNQYRLLEALYAEDAEHFRKVREALESGDSALIASYSAFIRFERPPLSDEDSSLVHAILSMYDALQASHRELSDPTDIEVASLQFPGFDAEVETAFRQYTGYLIEEEKEFIDLDRQADLTSVGPSLPMYRRMLEAWRSYANARQLSLVQILYLLQAGTEPTHD